MQKRIAIGGDHAGFAYKKVILERLQKENHITADFGPYSDASCDYPDFTHSLAAAVESGEFEYGILICGSGNGVCMTANKHQKVRAALVWEDELAKLARQHNDANVICLPARFLSIEKAIACVETFLNTDFEGGRHQKRVDKIAI